MKETVPIEEVVLSNVYSIEAIMNILNRIRRYAKRNKPVQPVTNMTFGIDAFAFLEAFYTAKPAFYVVLY